MILDLKIIEELKELNDDGNEDFFKELVNSYLSELPELMQEIIFSYKENDLTKMVNASHNLKGASLNMGASTLALICEAIERAGRENNLENINELLSNLESASQLTINKLIQVAAG